MLIYIGKGFLNGLPARNLTDDEVEALGGEKVLLATGLYKKPGIEKEEVKHGYQGIKKH